MKKKKRKARPQPPKWVWWDLDSCWCCKHKNGCSGCKILKSYVADQKNKNRRKNQKFDF